MQKRRAHNKSRRGCRNCKDRHVKCDEQGPPCANCISRKTAATCTYKLSPQDLPAAIVASRAGAIAQKPPLFDSAPGVSTLLQLELMHRWSTSTYFGFCGVPPDHEYMQVAVPRAGLEYQFMMDGLLAAAALDMAMGRGPDSARYLRAAMEFYDRSSASFRTRLTHVTPENFEWVFVFSSMLTIIHTAMPRRRSSQADSIVAVTATVFELMIGASSLAMRHADWLLASSYGGSARLASELMALELAHGLDNDSEQALARLETLVDATPLTPAADGDLALLGFELPLDMYRNAVRQLRRCYVEDAKGLIKGFCLGYAPRCGRAFVAAFRQHEPMALVIMMHWAVLLDKLNSEAWWAGSVGKSLVRETSDVLLRPTCELASDGECRDAIAWARARVGLQLIEGSPSASSMEGIADSQTESNLKSISEAANAS